LNESRESPGKKPLEWALRIREAQESEPCADMLIKLKQLPKNRIAKISSYDDDQDECIRQSFCSDAKEK
jgi:hypothetical protein